MKKDTLIIILAAFIFTLILLLPTRISCLFKNEPAFPCPFLIDKNQDGICDVLQTAPSQPTEGVDFDFSFWPQALILGSALTFSILTQYLNKLKLRIYILIFSFFYFGFFWSQICPIATFQSVFLQKEKVVLALPLFLIFILPIIFTLLFGRIFCHFICPLGGFQELVFRGMQRFAKIPNLTVKIPKKLFLLPYCILFITILGTTFTSALFFCKFEPFGQILGCKSSLISFLLLSLTLLLTPFIFRPFCHFFCPLGAVFKILSKFQIFRQDSSK